MKRYLALILCFVLVLSLFGCAGENSDGGYKIAVVPKSISSGWFQRMEEGVNHYNEEHGTDYFFGGATDVADQALYLEQLLAEDWDAICIPPYDTESIAPLLEKAKEEGIVIITHEADTLDPKYFDYDIEPFFSEDLGTRYGEVLVEATGGEGTYVQFVGGLNSVTHNAWCDAADSYISANSNLVKLGRYETSDDITVAYNLTKELLQAHPEIIAIEGSASTDVAGIARAVEELGLSGKVTIVGTSLSSICGEYITDGTIHSFSLWDPALAGEAMLALAEQILSQGDDFDPASCSLPIEGYETLSLKGRVFYGQARVDVNAENIGDFDF